MAIWHIPKHPKKYVPVDEQAEPTEKLLYTASGEEPYSETGNNDLVETRREIWKWKAATLGLCVLLTVLVTLDVVYVLTHTKDSRVPYLYSPAEEAVEFQTVVFHNNFHEDRTPYQGPPTDAVDQAWNDLYHNIGIVQIDNKSAQRLPNQTLPIPGDEDNSIVGIEVFHQLHCLNSIRKALYPDRYREKEGMTATQLLEYQIHLEHCVDSIRQTVQCYSDISTIPWIWNKLHNRPAPDAHTTHICRNFGKIQSWARQRAFPQAEYDKRLAAQQQQQQQQ